VPPGKSFGINRSGKARVAGSHRNGRNRPPGAEENREVRWWPVYHVLQRRRSPRRSRTPEPGSRRSRSGRILPVARSGARAAEILPDLAPDRSAAERLGDRLTRNDGLTMPSRRAVHLRNVVCPAALVSAAVETLHEELAAAHDSPPAARLGFTFTAHRGRFLAAKDRMARILLYSPHPCPKRDPAPSIHPPPRIDSSFWLSPR